MSDESKSTPESSRNLIFAKCPECGGGVAASAREEPIENALFIASLIADGLVIDFVSADEVRAGFGHSDSCSRPRPDANAYAIHCTVGDSSETYDESERGDCVADAEYFIREMADGDVLLVIRGEAEGGGS